MGSSDGGTEWFLPLCCVVFGGKTTAVEGVPAAVAVLACLGRGARLHLSSVNGGRTGACRRYRANLRKKQNLASWQKKLKKPGMVSRHPLATPGIFSNIPSPKCILNDFHACNPAVWPHFDCT